MTYLEFKNKCNGKVIDYDGTYGGQCWDLAQQYFVECLGLPESILGGCGLVSNMLVEPKISELLKYFDEVPMTEMCQGEVVIWTYGHIAIFDNWDGKNNWYFTQNPEAAHVGICPYSEARAFRKKCDKQEEKKEDNKIEEKNNNITYVVKAGDCLSLIGEAFGVNWQEIAKINNIVDPYIIYPNQELIIPIIKIDNKIEVDSIKVGDKVKVLKNVQYSGLYFDTYYDVYDVMEINNDRVVIGANNIVTCAININNIQKIK